MAVKFYSVLEPAFRHAAKISGPELDKAMIKTLNVWRDRQIYSEEQLATLDAVVKRRKPSTGNSVVHSHVHAPHVPELFSTTVRFSIFLMFFSCFFSCMQLEFFFPNALLSSLMD
ncbi:hypothetical protein TELCIR_05600 [Teladorsagia circumcincta]|uniref:CID domain-containing protein n=1 Tax=Teladorsagia circumcincta TaxID=45464 RepID=A0A2G9URY4_TELCI|nr:hypothetical protein TELCIR_05600 [Teladorsagia circumcincta]